MTKKYAATTEDLIEQVGFLTASMVLYDRGHLSEAKRLASVMRTLLSDAGGASVLRQLGVQNELHWFNSGGQVDPTNLAHAQVLTMWHIDNTEPDHIKFSYEPFLMEDILARPSGEWVDFHTWWAMTVIRDNEGRTYSRSDLVQLFANHAGGVHVAPLSPHEQALVSGEHFDWGIQVGDDVRHVTLNPVPASLRTMATEIEVTFQSQWETLGLQNPYPPRSNGTNKPRPSA